MVDEIDQGGSIQATPLWSDIKDIVSSANNVTKWTYKAMFHTVKEDIAIGQLIHWEENRDYAGMVGSSGHISFNLGLGDYQYRLYPNRSHMEISIKTIGLNNDGTEKDGLTDVQRFKVIFHPDKNPVLTAGKDALQTIESLNLTQMVKVTLEIQDRALEPLRRRTVGGVYRNVTTEQLIRGLMVGVSQQLEVEGKPVVDGIELDTPDNTAIQQEVLIPQGTLLSNLPTWCQEKGEGVYNTAIGTFFQRYDKKNLWFVFPLYQFKRFDKKKKKLIIYNVPPGRLNGVDKTYKIDGDLIKIISVNGAVIRDEAGNQELNSGFGFRLAHAGAMMSKPVKIENGKAIFERHKLMTEVGHQARGDGMHYAPVIKPGSNPFHEFSKILPSHSNHTTIQWENADPNLIYPGMPCMYVFMDHGKYVEQKGTVTGLFVNRNLQGRDGTGKVYNTHVTLGLTLDNYDTTPPLPKSIPFGDF